MNIFAYIDLSITNVYMILDKEVTCNKCNESYLKALYKRELLMQTTEKQ